MQVTIIRNDDWHRDWYKNISEYWACKIIGCNKWQLEDALDDDNKLKGWKIKEVYR